MKNQGALPKEGENQILDTASSTKPKRISLQYVLGEVGSVLSFQKGILYTIKELSIRPGKSIRTFLFEDRTKLVKPAFFLIFCSLVYTILQQFLRFEDSYFEEFQKDSTANNTISWVRGNWGYVNILTSLFFALSIRILFWRRKYNYFELLVLLFYVLGVTMLMYSVLGTIEASTGLEIYLVGAGISAVYMCWVVGQFYGKPYILNYTKSVLSYVLGWIFFTIATVILALLMRVFGTV